MIYNYDSFYVEQKGRIYEYKNEFIEAKQAFQNAVTIEPSHIKSLQHLVREKFHICIFFVSSILFCFPLQGLMYHYLGNQHLAAEILRIAAKLDPWSSQTW